MYTKSEIFWFVLQSIIFAIILVPTMIALFSGAPWVPTPIARVRKILDLARLKPGSRVYDLGCGDGRMVHLAAKEYQADAVGLELSPLIYWMGRVRNFILRSKAKMLWRDFRHIDYSNADALVCYLLPDILKVMREKLEKELKPGARVVSYAFKVEGWEPTYVEPKDPARNFSPIYVYEMPVKRSENGI